MFEDVLDEIWNIYLDLSRGSWLLNHEMDRVDSNLPLHFPKLNEMYLCALDSSFPHFSVP